MAHRQRHVVAKDFYERCLKSTPLSVQGQDSGKLYTIMNEGIDAYSHGEFTSAEKKFEEATSLYADNHMAWYNLGQTREKLDKFKEAGEAYTQADAKYLARNMFLDTTGLPVDFLDGAEVDDDLGETAGPRTAYAASWGDAAPCCHPKAQRFYPALVS